MARPFRTIDVFANPYSGITDTGLPQGVMQMPGSHNFIGASRDILASQKSGKTRIVYATPREGEPGAHGLRKFKVPFTAEIARSVSEGGLIVADAEHARMVGLSDFKDAETQLGLERARALAERQAQYGADATIEPIPTTMATDEVDPGAAATVKDVSRANAKGGAGKPLEGIPLAGSKTNPSLVLRKSEES